MWLRALKQHVGKHFTMSEFELSQLERQKRLSNAKALSVSPTVPVFTSNAPKSPQEEYEESIR